jgi:hypothetical protein
LRTTASESSTSYLDDRRRCGVWRGRGADRNLGGAPQGGFIAGDRPVTEDQVWQELQSEGYLNIQIARQGGYFEATGSKGGQTARILVDSQTGRLAAEHEDDDD